MRKSEISKTYYQKLVCRIYILGASSEGESILFIVYGDEQIIYSCITDSFKIDNVNIPITIAEQCGIEHITDIFWTHPHDDHSEGIIELIEKYKPEYVYIPADLQMLPKQTPELSRNVLEKINQYRSCNRRYTYQPCIVDVGGNYTILEKILNVANKKIPFSIYTVSPVIGKVRRDVISNNFNNLNNFSIVVSIIIGDFSVLLTGDIQNQMIKYISNDLQREIITPNLLKIPHHGSKGSLDILSLFNDDMAIDVSVSTAKKTSKLPYNESLNTFSSRCDRVYKISEGVKKIGIWGIEVDILKATVTELESQNYVVHTSV